MEIHAHVKLVVSKKAGFINRFSFSTSVIRERQIKKSVYVEDGNIQQVECQLVQICSFAEALFQLKELKNYVLNCICTFSSLINNAVEFLDSNTQRWSWAINTHFCTIFLFFLLLCLYTDIQQTSHIVCYAASPAGLMENCQHYSNCQSMRQKRQQYRYKTRNLL